MRSPRQCIPILRGVVPIARINIQYGDSLQMKISQRAQSMTPFFAMEFGKHAACLEAQGHKIIKLSLGEPDFDAPPIVGDAFPEGCPRLPNPPKRSPSAKRAGSSSHSAASWCWTDWSESACRFLSHPMERSTSTSTSATPA